MDIMFIVNTNTPWDEPPRARHQVTNELARKHKVVYVSSNKFGLPGISILNQPEDNLQIIQPRYLIDSRLRYRLPVINELYQRWLFRRLKKMFGDVSVVNFDFTAYMLHRYFTRIYYYCNDNFISISKKLNNRVIYKYHFYCENRLAKRSKLCIGTSSIITDRLLGINKHSFEIPLGGPNIKKFEISPSMVISTSPPLRIGLVGFIRNYNLSYTLINDILNRIDCAISLVGPVDPEFYENIDDKNRVILKGILTGKALLEEVNTFDVAIAPYLSRKINEGGMPNKLFLYLALGKPVVATELLILKKMNLPVNMIYLVDDMADFPSTIEQAHAENNETIIRQRIEFSQKNTWEQRISRFLGLINDI